MADYKVVSGDTFASLAKRFFGDESASKALALCNKMKDDSQPPSEGTVLSIPPRLYGVKSQETKENTATVTLSLLLQKQDDVVIFYSPGTKKYCILDAAKDDALSAFRDELSATKDLAQKILDGWQGQDFAAMLSTMQQLSRDVETFFDGLPTSPSEALDELLLVTKHPKWDEEAKRLFVRPGRLKTQGTWKDASDTTVRDILKALKDRTDDCGLDTSVLSALCDNAQDKEAWPWLWNFADAQSGAAAAADRFSSAVGAQFVRFAAGCGLSDELDEIEKKLTLGRSGDLTFSLTTGTLSGSWYLPQESGVNLFDLFGVSQSPQGDALTCLLRFQIDASGYACADSELSHFVSLPGLSLGNPVTLPQAGSRGSGSASGQGTLNGAISWSPNQNQEFAALATADLTAQLGASQQLSFAFSDKTLHCAVPLKNIKGLSGNGSLAFDVNSDEAMRLVEYVFGCVMQKYLSAFGGKPDGLSILAASPFKNVIDSIEQKAATVTDAAKSLLSWFNNGSVIDGTANAKWCVPDNQGFDLIAVIEAVPLLAGLLKPGVNCFVRMRIELSGYAFGSAGPAGGPSLPGGIPSVAMAAAGQGQLSATVEWRESSDSQFRTLGKIQTMAALSGYAGAAFPVPLAVEHKNGTLSGVLSLKAIPGLGSSQAGAVAFTASGAEADAFVNHLFSSLTVDLSSFMPAGAAQGAASAAGLAQAIDPNVSKDAAQAAKNLFG